MSFSQQKSGTIFSNKEILLRRAFAPFFFRFFDRRGSKGYVWRAPLTALGRALWASFKTIATTFYFPESFGFLSACLFSVKKTHMSCPYRQREAFKPRRKGRTKRASCGCTATFALLQKKESASEGAFLSLLQRLFFFVYLMLSIKHGSCRQPP